MCVLKGLRRGLHQIRLNVERTQRAFKTCGSSLSCSLIFFIFPQDGYIAWDRGCRTPFASHLSSGQKLRGSVVKQSTSKMPESKGKKSLGNLIAGGMSGMIARTCIAPIERIKILFQIQKGQGNYVTLMSNVLKSEGFLSMWKGNSAAIIRVIPYTSIQFSSFEEYKTLLGTKTSLPATPRDLGAGSLAGITACATTYPLDVVRARMALQNEGLANTRCACGTVFRQSHVLALILCITSC